MKFWLLSLAGVFLIVLALGASRDWGQLGEFIAWLSAAVAIWLLLSAGAAHERMKK